MTAKPSPDDPLRVSVAVSTYNRAGFLPRLVAALEAQTLPRNEFEVVVCDDGSRDDTGRVLAELAAATPVDVRVVTAERNQGRAAGRNRAWRASRAPVVAFTDDDCVPEPNWLEAGLAAMRDGRRVVVGRTIPNPEQEYRRGPFSLTISVEDATYFPTCNVFYLRADLESVGGFDEGFSTWGGEDTDLGWRVRDAGATPTFAPEALVLHEIYPSSFRAVAKHALRTTGIPRVVRIHPEDSKRLLHLGIFWKESHPRALLALAGLGLARGHPAALLLAAPWIAFRLHDDPLHAGPRRRIALLPGAFAIDVLEVYAMIRGSLEHRRLVL
jgi:GT2 family glycosyltransferase